MLKSEFSKNILKLLTGTMIAQALSILVSPILSRLYTPGEFGLFTLVTSIFSMITLISGGRYELALLLPKKKVDALNLLALSIFVNSLVLVVFYLVLVVLDLFWGLNKLGIWYYLLPVFVFILGCSQSLVAWYNRRKMYREIVFYKVSQSFLNNGKALWFGWWKWSGNGLLSAYFLSIFVSLIVVIYQLKEDRKLIRRSVSFRKMKELGIQYKRFPVYNSLQSLLDVSQINGLIYLISSMFGQFFVGIFSLAIRIMFVPMNIIGSSISQVFYQEVSELEMRNAPLLPLLRKTALRCLLLISPVFLIIMLFGPVLFALVFGEVWAESGRYAQYLSLWICLDFIRAPLSQIPLVINQQKRMLTLTLINNLILLGIFILMAIFLKEVKWILITVSISQALYNVFFFIWLYKTTKRHDELKNNQVSPL